MRPIKLASFVFLSAVLAAAGNSADTPKEGMYVERSADTREPIRPLIASVVNERPSAAKSGAANTARKFLPKAPIPRTGGTPSKEMRVMLETARTVVGTGETFLFVFGESRNSVWKVGTEVASHPKDFVIVPLEVKDRHRRVSLDETGMFKVTVHSNFTVEEISPTEFRVTLPENLAAGEYAWVYVGGGALRSGLRIFDFKLGAAEAKPGDDSAESR